MEKLKAKHDHKLTDILKVAIFGLMLILPGLILLPSMLYYGVNEYATAPTEQVEKIEYERVDFNQLVNSNNDNLPYTVNGITFTSNNNGSYTIDGTSTAQIDLVVYWGYSTVINNKYLVRDYENNPNISICFNGNLNSKNTILLGGQFNCTLTIANGITFNDYNYKGNLYNLTQMFGAGNEPTYSEFISYYPNYYEYTESRYEILEIPTGTYETYTDITSQIQYNWNSLWQQPLFSWTNYTILKQGLDNFTYVFGITQTSYINNLIVYELIIVAIYIVIDIILTLFKWLTHLIGEK